MVGGVVAQFRELGLDDGVLDDVNVLEAHRMGEQSL
jgi:hypothetical protein